MIQVHIESPSVEALHRDLNALLSGISKGTVKDVVQAVPEVAIAPVAADTAEAAEIKLPEPEKHEPAEEEAPVEVATVEKLPSMVDTRAALNKLRAAKGSKAVKTILQAHGVESFVELGSDHYAAVMKEAEEALNG